MKHFRKFAPFFAALLWLVTAGALQTARSEGAGPIISVTIDGTINPGTADYMISALAKAEDRGARLFLLRLNTPGGLLPAMQKMVEALLKAKVPTAVYVSPQGGGAMSAGVFITMAGHIAAMAPGTTIGAAHPVLGGGESLQGDMREKLENFAVSLARAIAEQRGRNVVWAEQAVRESVAITDRVAVTEKVVDLSASDTAKLFDEIEGRVVTVDGNPVTLRGLRDAPLEEVPMTLRQQMVSLLADPNIAVLLGIGALVGLGLELLHPGAIVPGVVGVICLVLSLVAGQIVPINAAGLALMLLGGALLVAELFLPSFGVVGGAGIVSLVLGSIYFVNPDDIWSSGGFQVNRWAIGVIAALAGLLLLAVDFLVIRNRKQRVVTGLEGFSGKIAEVVTNAESPEGLRVRVMGELWKAKVVGEGEFSLARGDRVVVERVEEGMVLLVKRG